MTVHDLALEVTNHHVYCFIHLKCITKSSPYSEGEEEHQRIVNVYFKPSQRVTKSFSANLLGGNIICCHFNVQLLMRETENFLTASLKYN